MLYRLEERGWIKGTWVEKRVTLRTRRWTTEDVDFANVAGLHWKGRAEVVREHAERHRVRFKEQCGTTERVTVPFLSPDIALVPVDWHTRGDLDFDLKP